MILICPLQFGPLARPVAGTNSPMDCVGPGFARPAPPGLATGPTGDSTGHSNSLRMRATVLRDTSLVSSRSALSGSEQALNGRLPAGI